MPVAITPPSPVACSTFTVQVTSTPAGVSAGDTATFTYDGQTQSATVAADGTTPPVTFTAVGSGAQTITVVYTSGATITGAEVVPVTVTPAPPWDDLDHPDHHGHDHAGQHNPHLRR
ncbi:hypothetical protein [Streptomyces sp. Rer75]|uniref:hypothetical protein n=1 Tax=unclassified Streptomyces TaxID=2593676 RepID=UPI0015D092E9|nr:hypothetical protein [Streptomyces sp. Rer75]QLH26363.1 hypothetical protein HYQ63_41880 [Streptomyces sp. Rer75]